MLDELISADQLKALVGEGAYRRGESYFREGRVTVLVDGEDVLTGSVEGSGGRSYRSRLEADGDGLLCDCTCPVGERGEPCKHLVALALTRLQGGPEAPSGRQKAGKGTRRGKEEEIRAFLEGRDKAQLVDWLLEAARSDRGTRERLLMAARVHGPASGVRKLVTEVTGVRGFVDYRAMPDFVRRVDALIDRLAGLQGAELMGLAEYAVERLHKVLENCDDSDGGMGGLLHRLAMLHARASGETALDPIRFARWLLDRHLEDEWDTWAGVDAYAGALGEEGLREYGRLARLVWDELPDLKPGAEDGDRWGRRFRVTEVMKFLARRSGDPDALVAVHAKDLSSSYAFVQIAQVYRDAGRHDEALDWMLRGLAAFPGRPDPRLDDLLLEERFRRGEQDEAMSVAWGQFARSPSAEGYQRLVERARRTADPASWRARALESLREEAVRRFDRWRPLYGQQRPELPDFTALVQARLWDQDLDGALAEAQEGLCNARVLARLAQDLAPSRPGEALVLLQRALNPIVDERNNRAYGEGAELIRRIRDLLRDLGREREFLPWLEGVRRAHKPKRNFMKLLQGL